MHQALWIQQQHQAHVPMVLAIKRLRELLFAVQDFGARDPTAGELGSNFGEKIVMNWDTEHIIK